ncbi:MAG: hypothetical protein HY980_03745 [Candidatus Magasanikbacteria bacterium]|nr:hypothetical protein [Candidatus Magasanikbacteria bacterium]
MKTLSRLISGLKFFVVVMAIAAADSLVLHFFISQIKSQYIVKAALSYHQEFVPLLEEIIQSRKIIVASDQKSLPPPTPAPYSPLPTPPPPTPPPTISEANLYNALQDYRTANGRTHLVFEENLCVYARKRVDEHLRRLETLGPDDKPLDAHAGFQRDADSGELFKITDMKAVAENLAYLPAYTTATQIIEWGWDSSTAHRDAQLSNDWTHVCLSGKYPFYVGIFGKSS